jgi:hypothetical protein
MFLMGPHDSNVYANVNQIQSGTDPEIVFYSFGSHWTILLVEIYTRGSEQMWLPGLSIDPRMILDVFDGTT